MSIKILDTLRKPSLIAARGLSFALARCLTLVYAQ